MIDHVDRLLAVASKKELVMKKTATRLFCLSCVRPLSCRADALAVLIASELEAFTCTEARQVCRVAGVEHDADSLPYIPSEVPDYPSVTWLIVEGHLVPTDKEGYYRLSLPCRRIRERSAELPQVRDTIIHCLKTEVDVSLGELENLPFDPEMMAAVLNELVANRFVNVTQTFGGEMGVLQCSTFFSLNE